MNNIIPIALDSLAPIVNTMQATREHGGFHGGFESSLMRATVQSEPNEEAPKHEASISQTLRHESTAFINQTTSLDSEADMQEINMPEFSYMPNYEGGIQEDSYSPDALAETSLSVTAPSSHHPVYVEAVSHGPDFITSADFTAMLNRVLAQDNSNGEQVWRFSLHENALPIAQISLASGVKQGQWYLTLTSRGVDTSPILLQQLDRLKTRLELLGQNIGEMIVVMGDGK